MFKEIIERIPQGWLIGMVTAVIAIVAGLFIFAVLNNRPVDLRHGTIGSGPESSWSQPTTQPAPADQSSRITKEWKHQSVGSSKAAADWLNTWHPSPNNVIAETNKENILLFLHPSKMLF